MDAETEKQLARIVMDIVFGGPSGQRAVEPEIQKAYAECQARGLAVTIADVRREFRDASGYP